MHEYDMGHFAVITEDQMEKRVFHVGNMDIYLRAAGTRPSAFYPSVQAG